MASGGVPSRLPLLSEETMAENINAIIDETSRRREGFDPESHLKENDQYISTPRFDYSSEV
jgi:hypothetical protein